MFEVKSSWRSELSLIPPENKTVYFTEEYVSAYQSEKIRSEAFIYQENESCFILPYLRQAFVLNKEELWDFETPYGYGGGISNTTNSLFLTNAWKSFNQYAQESKCIAGFIRFDPMIKNNELAKSSSFSSFFDRHTVAIDLTLTDEDIFLKEIHSKHRNVIRKAEKNNLEFVVDTELKYLSDFVDIYTETMSRLGADEFFDFGENHYKKLMNGLQGNSFFSVVLLNDEVISIAIIMLDELYGHYHLAGSKLEYLKYSPNNFLLFKTAIYLKSLGKVAFHIGGGTSSDESNSLFKFKKRFSKSLQRFYIGKKVFCESEYNEICNNWANENPEKAETLKNITLKYRF